MSGIRDTLPSLITVLDLPVALYWTHLLDYGHHHYHMRADILLEKQARRQKWQSETAEIYLRLESIAHGGLRTIDHPS